MLEDIVKGHYAEKPIEGLRAMLVAIDAFKLGFDAWVQHTKEAYDNQLREAMERLKNKEEEDVRGQQQMQNEQSGIGKNDGVGDRE
jgi:hypothetical protein